MTEPIAWLLKGDPSIRWQVMRDLLEEPPGTYEKEQAKIKAQGWGGRLLWQYDFLRALDYFQSIRADHDKRMKDAMELLKAKQQPNGRWAAYRPWPARVFFEMEKAGEDSRWNTLRALRVLKWWEERRPSNELKKPTV